MGNLVSQIRDVDVGRYYPDTVSPSKEFKAIAKTESKELNNLWVFVWKWILNTYVHDLDADGAKRWEQMLNLHPEKTDTLDIRRKTILAKINSLLPYTERSLQQILDGIYGMKKIKIHLEYNNYKLWLDVAPELILKSHYIKQYASTIAPANLIINISNTVYLDFRLFYSGLIRQTKHTAIHPSGDFKIEIQNSICIVAGTVRQLKYIKIRS